MGSGLFSCVVISMLLAKAVHTLPVSTAYPVWTGIGAVGRSCSASCFHEPVSPHVSFSFVPDSFCGGLKMV